jgi:hypothetical protein
MSFGGYAAPFVQGSTSRRDRVRRVLAMSPLIAGLCVGATLTALVLFLFEPVVALSVDDASVAAWVGAGIALLLGIGDTWSIRRGRLYPIGPRRQTRKAMMYQRGRPSVVGFMWGFDAGLGVTTYRVTSGMWVVALFVVLDLVSPWIVILYAVAFGIGLVALAAWPVRQPSAEAVDHAVFRRIEALGSRRRVGQTVYAALLSVVIATTVLAA